MAGLDLRFLRSMRDVGEINRSLIMASHFEETSSGVVSKRRFERAYNQSTVKGNIVSAEEVVKALNFLDLIRMDNDSLHITPGGKSLVMKNPQETYELTDPQKQQIVSYLLFGMKAASEYLSDFMIGFSFSTKRNRYEWQPLARNLPKVDLYFQFFLSSLGLLDLDRNGTHFLNPQFNSLLAKKIRIMRSVAWTEREPSEEDLRRFEHAEIIVEDYEKTRLRDLGRNDLAEMVKLVSTYDATMGFDVMSFEDQASELRKHDRFIEVKSSKGKDMRFYFTYNEMKKARELGDMYLIYFLGDHDHGKSIDCCEFIMIRNPAKELFDTGKYELNARKYLITKTK